MTEKIPRHIAMIMDGNGRWAQARGLSRSEGHLAGYENLKNLIHYIFGKSVEVLTLYAFSAENWQREVKEVDVLFDIFRRAIDEALAELVEENIKIRFIGDREGLISRGFGDLVASMERIEKSSAQNTGGILVPAINYGGRDELVRAVKKIVEINVPLSAIRESTISLHLDTHGLPEPDLIIRTAGEMRLSGFLLWQAEYAELYFSKKPWPDFTKRDFDRALKQYAARKRNFGRASSTLR